MYTLPVGYRGYGELHGVACLIAPFWPSPNDSKARLRFDRVIGMLLGAPNWLESMAQTIQFDYPWDEMEGVASGKWYVTLDCEAREANFQRNRRQKGRLMLVSPVVGVHELQKRHGVTIEYVELALCW
jgi:hypothetical protein